MWAATGLSLLLAAFFVVAAVIGTVRWSHPIPYWDMWDGHLSFWFQLQDGNPAIWWELSNEHHLLLLKALFWIDLALFSGSHSFLVAINLLLVLLTAVTLVLLLTERLRESRFSLNPLPGFVLISSVLVIMPFAWMQGEELVFPYHAQFLMNTVMPLAVFAFLGIAAWRSTHSTSASRVFFWAGVVLATLSPWTSASGLLVPFIAAGLVAVVGLGLRRAAFFLVIGVASIITYSIDSPFVGSSDGGALANLTSQPLDVLRFWLLYLGRPWSHVTGEAWIGGIAGVCFVLITVVYLIRELATKDRSIMGLAAISFPVFMLATAAVTSAGRVSYGMDQVLAIRYLTPMLTAWACLLIVASPIIQEWIATPAGMILLALILIPVILLPEQTSALRSPDTRIHERDTATLAVALNALDPGAIAAVYPISPERPLALGQRAMAEGIGVLGSAPYPGLAASVGASGPFAPPIECLGWLDSRAPLDGSTWDRVDGWVIADGHDTDRGVFTLTNGSGTIVGFITTGKPRVDVQTDYPDSSGLNGFSGYLDRSAASSDVFAVGDQFRCSNPLTSAVP